MSKINYSNIILHCNYLMFCTVPWKIRKICYLPRIAHPHTHRHTYILPQLTQMHTASSPVTSLVIASVSFRRLQYLDDSWEQHSNSGVSGIYDKSTLYPWLGWLNLHGLQLSSAPPVQMFICKHCCKQRRYWGQDNEASWHSCLDSGSYGDFPDGFHQLPPTRTCYDTHHIYKTAF